MGKSSNLARYLMTEQILTWKGTKTIRYFPHCSTLIFKPIYATGNYAVKFGFFFATYTASLTHAVLYHRQQIWSGIKSGFRKEHRMKHQNDIHNRLMRSYSEVPQWWYALVWVISFGLAAGALANWLPEAPIWVNPWLSRSNLSFSFSPPECPYSLLYLWESLNQLQT